jgi:hypothetical protein
VPNDSTSALIPPVRFARLRGIAPYPSLYSSAIRVGRDQQRSQSRLWQEEERPAKCGVGLGMTSISYRRHRFPPDIIQHAVWLYLRFPLSYRNVEDLLAERSIDVSMRRSGAGRCAPLCAH